MNLNDAIQRVCEDLGEYSKTLDAGCYNYWQLHQARFRHLTHLVGEKIEGAQNSGQPVERLLDIGNSYQTVMISRIWPSIKIDTLGFLDQRYAPSGETKHYDYDLNDSYFPERQLAIADIEKYDAILFLEVIEHLYTAPETVLDHLGTLLKPGGFIIIQTPNAASLIKRLRLLFGENPYELIRRDRLNPGHFREYSKSEIQDIAQESGFSIEDIRMTDYFPTATVAEKICQFVSKILPSTFKIGMTVILKKT